MSLKISTNVMRFVKGDRLRVHQVLSNLIDNAVKFTETGEVSVAIDVGSQKDIEEVWKSKLQEREGKEEDEDIYVVRFTVADTGIGISKENVEKLFTPFSQLDPFYTKKYQGTGMGLAICKRLVEMMHGKIYVTSELGVGSTFSFTIGFKRTRAIDLVAPSSTATASNLSDRRALYPEAKILIVEDNVVNQNVIKRVLKRLGYKNMDLAENGQEAVKKVTNGSFDIILMDIQMPVMDGYQATKEIRNTIKDVPIVAMTANALKGDAEKCLAAGMNDYVSKPMDIQLLSTVMNHWLASSSMNLKNFS